MGKLILKSLIEKVLKVNIAPSSDAQSGFQRKGGTGPYVKKREIEPVQEHLHKKDLNAYETDVSSKADRIMAYFDCKNPGDCDNWRGSWKSMIEDICTILLDVQGLRETLRFTVIIKFTKGQEFWGTNSHTSIQVHDRNYEYGYQVGLWQSGDVRLEPLRHTDPSAKDKIFYAFSNELDPQSLKNLTDELKKEFDVDYIYQWVPLQKGFVNCATWAMQMAGVAGQKIPLEFGWLLHSTYELKDHLQKQKSFSRTVLTAKK